jgi:L-seryl-tRNA(Ser) seleniumtransferase
MQLLPRLQGLKDQVIMPRASRNEYDHAIRAVGVEIVMVRSREEFRAALGQRVAMVAVLGERPGEIPLLELCQTAHAAGIPVLVDASAEVPSPPNAYLQQGADLVGISGGKYLAGPQCAGILIGRKDLVRAAWANSAPHHGFGRAMKVGKEEIMGLLAAVETFVHRRKYQDDLRVWSAQLREIAAEIAKVPGVSAALEPSPAPNPHPRLRIAWDTARIPLSADDVYEQLLAGEPRIMSHAAGEGNSFYARAAGMKPGDEKAVARRLSGVFRGASGGKPKEQQAPAIDISGRWVALIRFASGSTTHELDLRLTHSQVSGVHKGKSKEGRVTGTVAGDEVRLLSSLPYDSIKLQYHFSGQVSANGMAGTVDLGEFGTATWTAKRA